MISRCSDHKTFYIVAWFMFDDLYLVGPIEVQLLDFFISAVVVFLPLSAYLVSF